jgi:hypothetical protein
MKKGGRRKKEEGINDELMLFVEPNCFLTRIWTTLPYADHMMPGLVWWRRALALVVRNIGLQDLRQRVGKRG